MDVRAGTTGLGLRQQFKKLSSFFSTRRIHAKRNHDVRSMGAVSYTTKDTHRHTPIAVKSYEHDLRLLFRQLINMCQLMYKQRIIE